MSALAIERVSLPCIGGEVEYSLSELRTITLTRLRHEYPELAERVMTADAADLGARTALALADSPKVRERAGTMHRTVLNGAIYDRAYLESLDALRNLSSVSREVGG